MFEAAGFELLCDFGWLARHLLDHRTFGRGEVQRTIAQHDHLLLGVEPPSECQHNFKGLAADNNYIDAGIEFLEAVRLLSTCIQEIERVVGPSQKAIDAYSAED